MQKAILVAAVAVMAAALPADVFAQPKTKAAGDHRLAIDRTIRALEIEWWRAAGRRKVEQFVAYYHDDAELNPPGAPKARGKAAIRKVVEALLTTPGVTIRGETATVNVAEAGDLAYVTGVYEIQQRDSAGKVMKLPGKYIVIWKKDSLGRWKAAVDFFNTDQ